MPANASKYSVRFCDSTATRDCRASPSPSSALPSAKARPANSRWLRLRPSKMKAGASGRSRAFRSTTSAITMSAQAAPFRQFQQHGGHPVLDDVLVAHQAEPPLHDVARAVPRDPAGQELDLHMHRIADQQRLAKPPIVQAQRADHRVRELDRGRLHPHRQRNAERAVHQPLPGRRRARIFARRRGSGANRPQQHHEQPMIGLGERPPGAADAQARHDIGKPSDGGHGLSPWSARPAAGSRPDPSAGPPCRRESW